jgi:hypothetical protein
MTPKPVPAPENGCGLVRTGSASHRRADWEAEAQEIAAAGDDALIWPELANKDDAQLA